MSNREYVLKSIVLYYFIGIKQNSFNIDVMTEKKKEKKIVPICSFCDRIRDKEGVWKKVNTKIYKFKEVALSHSVCPGCRKKHYKGM